MGLRIFFIVVEQTARVTPLMVSFRSINVYFLVLILQLPYTSPIYSRSKSTKKSWSGGMKHSYGKCYFTEIPPALHGREFLGYSYTHI